MKPRFTFSAALLLTCLILMNQACSAAEVSEEDFKALKDLVIQQGRRLDQLEQAHEGRLSLWAASAFIDIQDRDTRVPLGSSGAVPKKALSS